MLGIQKTSASQQIPVWQRVHETAQGGFTLDKTGLTDGQVIPAGSPFGFNEGTRIARVIKTATITRVAGGTDTDYYVNKGHVFNVGDIISSGIGGKAYAITAIDPTASATEDKISVGTSLGAMAIGGVLFQSSASGATAGALIVAPVGLSYEDYYVVTNKEVSIVLRGTVYARRVPGVIAGITSLITNIIYSQSF